MRILKALGLTIVIMLALASRVFIPPYSLSLADVTTPEKFLALAFLSIVFFIPSYGIVK